MQIGGHLSCASVDREKNTTRHAYQYGKGYYIEFHFFKIFRLLLYTVRYVILLKQRELFSYVIGYPLDPKMCSCDLDNHASRYTF